MPRLTEYISVGFCQGYGDGDYRVNMTIQDLSRAEMNDLMLSMFHAQRHAWDIWSRGQAEQQPATQITPPEQG